MGGGCRSKGVTRNNDICIQTFLVVWCIRFSYVSDRSGPVRPDRAASECVRARASVDESDRTISLPATRAERKAAQFWLLADKKIITLVQEIAIEKSLDK